MTQSVSRSPHLSFFVGASALILSTACTDLRSDSSTGQASTYQAPRLQVLDEAPPIPYSEVYVPVDAHAYREDGDKLRLSSSLVVRNTNKDQSLVVKRIDLYGQDGNRIRRVAAEPFELRPFASAEFLTQNPRADEDCSHCQNDDVLDLDVDPRHPAAPSHFVVQWGKTDAAHPPLIETVMVDEKGKILYSRTGRDLGKVRSPRVQPKASRGAADEPSSARPVHASVAPDYELIRYDSNMGLRPKNP